MFFRFLRNLKLNDIQYSQSAILTLKKLFQIDLLFWSSPEMTRIGFAPVFRTVYLSNFVSTALL